MALTPTRFSQATAFSGAWDPNAHIMGYIDTGGGTLANRRFSIGQINKMLTRTLSNLGTASAAGAGAFRYVTDLTPIPGPVVSTGSEWRRVFFPVYDLGLFLPGNPDNIAQPLLQKIMVIRNCVIPGDFAGAIGHVGNDPDATFEIDVRLDGSSVGTISISTSGTFTFSTSDGDPITITAPGRLEFFAPTTTELGLADVSVTIPAILSLQV